MNGPAHKPLHLMVAPLDWGLGHATRCIPLIRALLERGVRVSLGGSGASLRVLQQAFPVLQTHVLPGYDVVYGRGNSQVIPLFTQLPKLLQTIRQEHRWLSAKAPELGLDGVISDNRYGLWSPRIPSVFVCHQLAVRTPWPGMEAFTYRLHRRMWRNFGQLWIPDFEGERNLAGRLSHPAWLPENACYLGPLSHLAGLDSSDSGAEAIFPDILAVLSGPEPQRTILEKKLLEQAKQTGRMLTIVQGKAGIRSASKAGRVKLISYLGAAELAPLLARASVVISRSGYSSLMDYAVLGVKKLILVPTPGQSEQEYLAARFFRRGMAFSVSQQHFQLAAALEGVTRMRGFATIQEHNTPSPQRLHHVLDQWLNELRTAAPGMHRHQEGAP